MQEMITKAAQAISENGLLKKGDKVIAALSGGADSVALFAFLMDWCPAHGVTLYAAHVHHGLRAAADADEAFVRQLCEKSGVPLFVCHAELGAKGETSEDAARRARYAFFEILAAQYGAKIATAHTLSDNAETVLLRLARGTSLSGAGGIPMQRGAYIRPFLRCTRAETEAFCQSHALCYVTDETNFELHYARNRVRHAVLPQLGQVNTGAAENIACFAQDAAETAAYLRQQAAVLIADARVQDGILAEPLCSAPAPVRRTALCLLVHPYCTENRALLARCEDALLGRAQKAELVRGVYAAVRAGRFEIWRGQTEPTACTTPEIPLFVGSCTDFEGFPFEISVCTMDEMIKICKHHKKELKNFADYDMIKNNPAFRTRRIGDRFCAAGRGVTKTLKKLFIEQGVPLPLRAHIPLLAAGDLVLWVYGYGVCETVAVTSATKRVLYMKPLNISGGKENA